MFCINNYKCDAFIKSVLLCYCVFGWHKWIHVKVEFNCKYKSVLLNIPTEHLIYSEFILISCYKVQCTDFIEASDLSFLSQVCTDYIRGQLGYIMVLVKFGPMAAKVETKFRIKFLPFVLVGEKLCIFNIWPDGGTKIRS